jgi:hypothetical protein
LSIGAPESIQAFAEPGDEHVLSEHEFADIMASVMAEKEEEEFS